MSINSSKKAYEAGDDRSLVSTFASTRISRQAVPRPIPPFVFLGFIWLLSLLVLMIPTVDSLILRIVIMAVPTVLTLLVTWNRPADGYLVWSFVIALLVLQTGFQLDIGALRVSALEVVLLVLLLLLFWQRRHGLIDADLRLPGQKQLLIFMVFAFALMMISLANGTPIENAIMPFKGFVLYPLLAYILIAGLQTEISVRRFATLLIAGYTLLSIVAIFQFWRGMAQGEVLFQSSADYAPVNIFGITAAVIALFLIGIIIQEKTAPVAYLVVGILIFGTMASLSRSAGITLVAGMIYMIVAGRGQRRLVILLPLLLFLITLLLIPEEALYGRLLQLTDSSTEKRRLYLLTGLQAWKASWLFGWGWGKSFLYTGFSGSILPSLWEGFLTTSGRLIPRDGIPWYHNDYLNLLVQAGIIGLTLYLIFWQRVFSAGHQWMANSSDLHMRGYVLGSLSALFGLLVAALFEHVLWRPDIAGLVGVFLGLLVVSMRLGASENNSMIV